MKVTFKTGSEANYGSTNGELFFASNTKQIMLNGIKYIPKKLSELTNDSGFLTSITKSMVEGVLTGNITSHTHTFASLTSKPTTLEGYGFTDAMRFIQSDASNYVGARFNDTTLATKAANAYIEFWQGVGGWFNLKAGKFITNGGTSSQFLKGDGSLDSNTYALSSALNNYLPLGGGILTGNLTCNGSYITMSGGAGAKGYSGYFNNPKRSDRASYSHILGDGYAYGENSISIGASAYAGIRNTDSDSSTYPYLHWKWMNCLQIKEITSAGEVNCYGAILNNLGGAKDTAKFKVCVGGVCIAYDESKGEDDPTNQFLKFTNTNANYGRVVVFIANTDTLIFGGNTSHPRNMCNLKIGNMILGQGSKVTDVASMTINGKTVYRLAIDWWSGTLPNDYDITKATTAMVCTKVNDSNYNGASSYASGKYSVASGYFSVASGYYSVASSIYSVASGTYSVASGNASVASGASSVASGSSSVASGASSVASGIYSVASGAYSVASGYTSVASGIFSVASGDYSIASGYTSVAKHSHSKVYAAQGVSGADYQTVLGRYNVETTGAVVVGWGSSDTSRENIFVLGTNGNATFGSGGAGTVTAATFNGSLNGTATNASKLATARTIKVGSASKSFDGSGDIEFALNNIITQNDTINVGTLNVAEQTTTKNITIGNNLTISSGADISGLTPSMIGAAAASHTHNYLPLSGGTMSNTNLVTNLNADLLDGYHHSSFAKIASANNLIFNINEFTFVPSDFAGTIYINYKTTGGANGAITQYTFCDGARRTLATISQGQFSGNAASSSKWANARTITLTGSVTGSVSLDGSANVSLATALDMENKHLNVGSITTKDSITAHSISANSISCGNKDVSLVGHTHTFASLTSKPTTLSGYGITDAMYFYEEKDYLAARFNNAAFATKAANTYIEFWQSGAGWFNLKAGKFITKGGTSSQFLKGDGSLDSNTYALSSALNNYLPLSGGTLTGNLTVPTLTSTGGILLGDSSLSAMVGSIGIQRYDETGFIGFLKDFNLGNSFNGVVLGWDGNYSLQENSVRIDASTFTYKGNSVLHSGNLGYTSSGLSRAVQKDANGNLFIVAPSLFEQGISNNYPKNLRWTTETEGQLVYDKEIKAGNFDTVEIGIPLADGTSKGFLKSTSTVTNVTGYTPCPVVSGTPYYKLDAIELDYTDFLAIGSGSIESNVPINTTIQQDGNLGYLLNYTVDNIPRLLTIAIGSYCKYFFWLQQTDDENPIVAYYHCQFNDLWLVIDSPNMEVRISQGSF